MTGHVTRPLLSAARVLVVLALAAPGTYLVLRGLDVAETHRPATRNVAPPPADPASPAVSATDAAPSTVDAAPASRSVYVPAPQAGAGSSPNRVIILVPPPSDPAAFGSHCWGTD